jgi:hypothetical protein
MSAGGRAPADALYGKLEVGSIQADETGLPTAYPVTM